MSTPEATSLASGVGSVDLSADDPAPEANAHGMGTTASLQLRQEVTDMRLHRLLRQEQALADLPVHQPVCDELQDLHLAGGRLLLELSEHGRGEGDDRSSTSCGRAAGSRGLEAAAVIAVAIEDFFAFCGVHETCIDGRGMAL